MELGGELSPSNIEDLRNLRVQARPGKTVTQEPVGRDQQGHEIEVASSNPRPEIKATRGSSDLVAASEVSQVATTPEQAIQELELSVKETDEVASVLGNLFKSAPTMACLRILDFSGLHDETTKLGEANQGIPLSEKKLILNNGQPPVRLAVPVPGNTNEWTSVVPSIIPAGIKTRFLDGCGKWIEMETPNREPTPEESQEVRGLIQKALKNYYGFSEAERMLSLSEGEMTVKNVGDMMAAKPETNTNALVHFVTMQGDQGSLQEARQQLASAYVPLLEALSAAAEFVARGAGVVVGAVGGALAGFADGAMEGGQVAEKALDKAPLIISAGPIAAVPVLAGVFLGGITGPIRALPQAVRTAFNYFSPQRALEKSISALSRWSDTGHVVSLLHKANEADEKIKTDIKVFLEPFNGDVKYQKVQAILTGQIDQKITERIAVIQQLDRKKEEQIRNVIPTSGPIGTKRSARVRL